MSNSAYVKMAHNGLGRFIAGFPQDSGNLKYNATKLRSLMLTRDGADWRYTISGKGASYAEPLNEGYDQWLFGKNTHQKNTKHKGFIEEGVGRVSRYLKAQIMLGDKFTRNTIQRDLKVNDKRFDDDFKRKITYNRSVSLIEEGKVTVGKPKNFRA